MVNVIVLRPGNVRTDSKVAGRAWGIGRMYDIFEMRSSRAEDEYRPDRV